MARLCIPVIIIFLALSGPAAGETLQSGDKKQMLLDLENKGKFEVLYDRAL